jgi:tryptophan synthase beta chain
MACAALGLKVEVYMGSEDMKRQRLNVFRMRLLGAKVIEVNSGSRTLKDAINEAFRDWVTNLQNTHYLLGSAVGPHPYPMIVRDFQSVIGKEIREQMKSSYGEPDALVACVGGGSNAIGTFHPFINDDVQLYGVEAGGKSGSTGKHAATLSLGSEGVFHGMATYVLQDEDGQILDTDSVAAGLDYPGVGPEHSYLKSTGRVHYSYVTDAEALEAFSILSREEGILPALEAAHGLAFVMKKAAEMKRDQRIVLTLSGRGDKDVEVVGARLGML